MKTDQPAFPTWKRADDMAEGMTLRDYFAAAALQCVYTGFDTRPMNAVKAYEMADAMMKAREQ